MFKGCSSLLYINLDKATLQNINNKEGVFDGISDNIIICSKDSGWNSLLNGYNLLINCNNNLNSNDNDIECYMKNNNIDYTKYLCDSCGQTYYQENKDNYISNSNINCKEAPVGYYLDKTSEEPILKECYSSCKKCAKDGTQEYHNCVECNDNFFIKDEGKYSLLNCYESCDYYHYTNTSNNKAYCTTNKSCPEKYNKLIEDKNECVEMCSIYSLYIYEYDNKCFKSPLTTTITTIITPEYIIPTTNIITTIITTLPIIPTTIISTIITTEPIIQNNILTSIITTEPIISTTNPSTTTTTTKDTPIPTDKILTTLTTTEFLIPSTYLISSEISKEITDNIKISFSNMNTYNLINSEISTNALNHLISTNIYSNEISENGHTTTPSNKIANLFSDEITRNKSPESEINDLNISDFESIKDYIFQNYNKTIFERKYLEFKLINNLTIIFTTTEYEKFNLNHINLENNKNKTSIDLKECETILKKEYNISINEPLFLFKVEINISGMKIPKVEYEIYYPLYGQNKMTKLDLKKCENKKIDISINVDINNDNIEKYNSTGKYYNDICSKTILDKKNENKKMDISISDRRNEFINNNMTLCEEDCNIIGYNYTTKIAKCNCLIKLKFHFLNEIKFDKKRLLKNFIDINNFLNIKFMKCYKNIIIFDNLKNNYSFYMSLYMILLYFIILILFWCKYYSILLDKINQVTNALLKQFKKNKINNNNSNNLKKNNNKNNNKTHKNLSLNNLNNFGNNNISNNKNRKAKKEKINNKKIIIANDNNNNISNKKIKLKKNNKINNTKNINKLSLNLKNKKIKLKSKIKKNKYNKNKISSSKSNNNTKSLLNISVKKNETKFEEILKYNDNELNSLDYEKALIYDKRTYSQYYISLLREKNLLIFSFYNNKKEYNSQIIKIFLFFLFFQISLTINTLFFSDDSMHEIYISEGEYSFIYQIPKIIYSTFVSVIINILIKFLSLTESNVIKLKEKSTKNFDISQKKKLYRIIFIKLVIFFILSLILLLSFGYYLICFCSVYTNTQIHIIKDTASSLALSLIYPFGISLIPGLLRICALRDKNKNKKYVYLFSKLVQVI